MSLFIYYRHISNLEAEAGRAGWGCGAELPPPLLILMLAPALRHDAAIIFAIFTLMPPCHHYFLHDAITL